MEMGITLLFSIKNRAVPATHVSRNRTLTGVRPDTLFQRPHIITHKRLIRQPTRFRWPRPTLSLRRRRHEPPTATRRIRSSHPRPPPLWDRRGERGCNWARLQWIRQHQSAALITETAQRLQLAARAWAGGTVRNWHSSGAGSHWPAAWKRC